MFWFQLVVALVVLGGIAWVAAGRGGELSEAHPDRPDLAAPADRQLSKPMVDDLRFNVGVRGYRMAEVDEVLDRLAAEIAERDARIAQLTGARAGAAAGERVAGPADAEPGGDGGDDRSDTADA